MGHALPLALINGASVLVGLFVLWSLVGGMKRVPALKRLGFAAVAGAVSMVVTFVFASVA